MRREFTVAGKVPIRPNLILAPMAGVTDSPFRRLIKEIGGVGLIVTEFVSVEGLTRGNLRTHRLLRFLPEERPISIQIFGYDLDRMQQAGSISAGERAQLRVVSSPEEAVAIVSACHRDLCASLHKPPLRSSAR